MKNYIKITVIFLTAFGFSLYSGSAFSQTQDNTTAGLLRLAKQYQTGTYRNVDLQKAFLIYSNLARKKSPQALCELGRMYSRGEGTAQDYKRAIDCFQEAVDLDYAPAMCKLAYMFQRGEGTKQDFRRAFELYDQAAQKGYAGGYYGAGYLTYKGLGGVQQSYKKALDYFQKGADMNDAPCEYMIAVYYLDGFENNQNIEKGKQYMERAMTHGHPWVEKVVRRKVIDSLKIAYKKDPNGWSDVKNGRINHIYRTAQNSATPEQLTGAWSGKVYTYDWAGKKILMERDVKLTMEASDTLLTLQWFAGDTLVTDYYAHKKSAYWAPPAGRQYHVNAPAHWFINQSKFEMVTMKKDTFLFANLQTYHIDTREPRLPLVAVLQRDVPDIISIAAVSPDSAAVAPIVITKVYPNPFRNKISVDYTLTAAQRVTAEIYDTMGNKYVSASPVNGVKGKNTQTLTVTLPKGDYTLYLKGTNYICSSIIIAK